MSAKCKRLQNPSFLSRSLHFLLGSYAPTPQGLLALAAMTNPEVGKHLITMRLQAENVVGKHLITMRLQAENVVCPSCVAPLPAGEWADAMSVPFKRCTSAGCQKRVHMTARSCLFDSWAQQVHCLCTLLACEHGQGDEKGKFNPSRYAWRRSL
eukprot:5166376-Amphidinium_carterae.1